jgi:acyl carrier protein
VLPGYLVPSVVGVLDTLPLTANGKVDRAGLPVPEVSGARGAHVAPRTAMEMLVAEVWSEVFGLPRISIHDDFFDLGGHSLTAVQMVSRLRTRLGREVSLRAVFDAPTVAGLVEALARPAGMRSAGLESSVMASRRRPAH